MSYRDRHALKATAEAFVSLLDLGVLRAEKVVAWVDQQIAAMDEPPLALIDASLLTRDTDALMNALRSMPGEADREEVLRQTFQAMRRALAEAPSLAPDIASALYRMTLKHQVPEGGKDVMLYLDDAFSLADDGIGDPQQVRRELQVFLDHYAEADESSDSRASI